MTRPPSARRACDVLVAAYHRSLDISMSEKRIRDTQEKARETAAPAKVPKGLATEVKKRLKANPAMPWDGAVALEVNRHG